MVLKIGTRVRIIADYDGTRLVPIGSETHIIDGPDYYNCNRIGPVYGYMVALRPVETALICRPEELEPIIPESSKPGDWADSPWQPEEVPEEVIVR